MRDALETFVADVNFVDWEINGRAIDLIAVSRKHPVYYILQRLEILQVKGNERVDAFHVMPTEQWLKVIVEEHQLKDEVEQSECPPNSILFDRESYERELSKMSDMAIFGYCVRQL